MVSESRCSPSCPVQSELFFSVQPNPRSKPMKPQIKSMSKAITKSFHRKRALRTTAGLLISATLGVIAFFTQSSSILSGIVAAQGERISPSALRQIEALMEEKESRTPAQKKIDSQLIYRLKQKRGQRIAPGV